MAVSIVTERKRGPGGRTRNRRNSIGEQELEGKPRAKGIGGGFSPVLENRTAVRPTSHQPRGHKTTTLHHDRTRDVSPLHSNEISTKRTKGTAEQPRKIEWATTIPETTACELSP